MPSPRSTCPRHGVLFSKLDTATIFFKVAPCAATASDNAAKVSPKSLPNVHRLEMLALMYCLLISGLPPPPPECDKQMDFSTSFYSFNQPPSATMAPVNRNLSSTCVAWRTSWHSTNSLAVWAWAILPGPKATAGTPYCAKIPASQNHGAPTSAFLGSPVAKASFCTNGFCGSVRRGGQSLRISVVMGI